MDSLVLSPATLQRKLSGADYGLRKDDAELEFFKMIVLSVKVSYPEMDKVCLLEAEELFHEAKSQKIPFFKFYDWIKAEMDRQTLEALFEFKNTLSTSF